MDVVTWDQDFSDMKHFVEGLLGKTGPKSPLHLDLFLESGPLGPAKIPTKNHHKTSDFAIIVTEEKKILCPVSGSCCGNVC